MTDSQLIVDEDTECGEDAGFEMPCEACGEATWDSDLVFGWGGDPTVCRPCHSRSLLMVRHGVRTGPR